VTSFGPAIGRAPTFPDLAIATIHVTGLDAALRRVKNAPRQVRFAAAQAANETAKSLQTHVVGRLLPGAFTLRSRGAPWWKPGTRFGFNIKFAKRTQPEPFAILGSRADWLALQEVGGVKHAPSGRSLAVPQVGTARPSPTSVIRAASKPRRILASKRGFIMEGPHGRMIMSRVGRGRSSRLKFWYGFSRTANIKPVLRFGPTESALAARLLPLEFQRALRQALVTAK
jgi:hypothetical protein